MKANESVKNYPSKLRESTNYSVRAIKNICKTIGPRAPGSENEKKAQEFIGEELKSCCDTVEIEEFPVHPNAFLGWVPLCSYLMIIGAVLFNLGLGLVSLVITVVAFSFVFGEFILYKPMLDPFFRKKISRNVIGIRKPSGELKRRIIFSGHCDSSQEWTFTHLGGPKLLTFVIVSSIISFVVGLVLPVIAVVKGSGFSFSFTPFDSMFLKVLGYVFLGFTPLLFFASFFCNWRLTVMGANDNLSGSMASVAVAKFMELNGIRFENTEVRILVTGSEEAGLRGSKDYMKKHGSELKDIETVFCGTDTLKDLDFIAVYNRDMTGTVKHNPQACALLKKAGSEAGFELPYESIFVGASDAAAVTQAGVPAAALAAMDPAPARYYHTRLDTEAILEPKSIEAGLNILLETAFLFDEQGLKDSY